MIAAQASDDRRAAPRVALLTAVVVAHGAAIWLLVGSRSLPSTAPDEPLLTLFDVPLLREPTPPPPAPAARPSADVELSRRRGGSPGTRQDRPARRMERLAPPARAAMEVTASPLAPPAPFASLPLGSALVDLGSGGVSGIGDGSGDGSGEGAGENDGGPVRYARALWVRKPSDADFRRVWPVREVDGKKVRQTGWAFLACKVRPDGQPFGCKVVIEHPASLGMGEAAIDVANRTLVRPVLRDKAAADDIPVLIPIIFGDQKIRLPRVSEAFSAPRAR